MALAERLTIWLHFSVGDICVYSEHLSDYLSPLKTSLNTFQGLKISKLDVRSFAFLVCSITASGSICSEETYCVK